MDVAIYVCKDFTNFYFGVEEKVWTFLTFDIVNMDNDVSEDMKQEIKRDGGYMKKFDNFCSNMHVLQKPQSWTG